MPKLSVLILAKNEENNLHDCISSVKFADEVLVIDDGKGFDVTRHDHSGIGFINIRSRAEAHDGEVNIISAPDRGCTLELLFPLRKNGLSELSES